MLKIISSRLTSIGFWVGVFSMLLMIFSVSGIELSTITSWKILFDDIVKIISNPYLLVSIAGQMFSYLNNPTDKKNF